MKNANKTKPRVPVLRFPEFMGTGEWEEKKMRNVGTIVASGDLDKKSFSNHASATYPYPVYSNAITKEGLYGYYSIYKYSADSITITARGTLGFAFLRTNKFMGIGRLIVISVNKKEYYPYFLKECWNHLVEIAVETTSIPQLTAVSVKTIELPFPPLPEQKKIAKCLTALDEHIALQIEELNALKAHKKGLLQKLFPAAGATVPELRFAEFVGAGDWEEKKMLDIGTIVASGDLDKKKFSNNASAIYQYPVYSNAITEEGLYGYYSIYKYPADSITITARGTLGIAFLRTTKFMGIGRLIVISVNKKKYYPYFLKECWNHLVEIAIETTSIPQLTAVSVKTIELPFPSIKEQQKIAECLTALDKLISAQAEKIEFLKEHKKGLLQQLFPQIDKA